MTPVVPTHGTIRSGREISKVVRSSHQRAGRRVVVHAARRSHSGPARVAVVASRRVGGAVQRNRAKRLIREAARHVALRSGTDVVVVARRSCADSTMLEVHAELERLATELDLVQLHAGARR